MPRDENEEGQATACLHDTLGTSGFLLVLTEGTLKIVHQYENISYLWFVKMTLARGEKQSISGPGSHVGRKEEPGV